MSKPVNWLNLSITNSLSKPNTLLIVSGNKCLMIGILCKLCKTLVVVYI